jgi:ferredoxin
VTPLGREEAGIERNASLPTEGALNFMGYTVLLDKCTADENCAAVCPVDCITFPAEIEGKAQIDQDECIDCAACIDECAYDAIIAS